MKRLHLHVGVADLDRSVGFYSTLFGCQPSVRKTDYAKWMLDDPLVNFAVSTGGHAPGLDHVGVQVSSNEELADITSRLKAADASVFEQENTTCCYAQSDKTWVTDPSGLRWETFVTHGDATTYGAGPPSEQIETATPSAPSARTGASCCG